MPEVLRPINLSKEGEERLAIQWSDGHDTGIFTLENLRALCECEQCRSKSV